MRQRAEWTQDLIDLKNGKTKILIASEEDTLNNEQVEISKDYSQINLSTNRPKLQNRQVPRTLGIA